METGSSYMRLMQGLDDGEQAAFTTVYNRFIHRMVALVAARINPHLRSKIDPESVAHAAMESFFRGYEKGRYDFEHWGGIMNLIATITLRKAKNRIRAIGTAKRNAQLEVSSAMVEDLCASLDPAAITECDDMIRHLLGPFDDLEKSVIQGRLNGSAWKDIAKAATLTEKTCTRIFDRFRHYSSDYYERLTERVMREDDAP